MGQFEEANLLKVSHLDNTHEVFSHKLQYYFLPVKTFRIDSKIDQREQRVWNRCFVRPHGTPRVQFHATIEPSVTVLALFCSKTAEIRNGSRVCNASR